MRELEELEWRSGVVARRVREGAGGGLAAWACAAIFASEARPRSGLAYGAGFAGVVYLFRPAAAALASEWLGLSWPLVLAVASVWGVAAPVALALGLAAGREFDRAPWKVGRGQAFFGFLLGLFGTLGFLFDLTRWL